VYKQQEVPDHPHHSALASRCAFKLRPIILLLSEGQMSDHKGAALMLPHLPPAKN
jgi:putative transposase